MTYNIRIYLESDNRWMFNGNTIPLNTVPTVGLHLDLDNVNTYIVKDVCLVYRKFTEYYSVLVDYDNTYKNKYWKQSLKK